MKVSVNIKNRVVVVDGEGVIVDQWESFVLPPGVNTIEYDTDSKSGIIIWEDSRIPNMPISGEHFNTMIAQFVGQADRAKVAAETKRAELMRELADKQSADLVKAQEDKLAEIRAKAKVNDRLKAIEKQLGLPSPIDEEREII